MGRSRQYTTRDCSRGRSGAASPPDNADFPDSITGAIRCGKSARQRRLPRLDHGGDQVRQVRPTTPTSQTRSRGRSGAASPPDNADFPDSITGAIRCGKSARQRRLPRLDHGGDQVRPTQPHETALASYARPPDPYRFEGNPAQRGRWSHPPCSSCTSPVDRSHYPGALARQILLQNICTSFAHRRKMSRSKLAIDHRVYWSKRPAQNQPIPVARPVPSRIRFRLGSTP